MWNVDGDRWRKHHDDLDVLSIERDDGQEFAIVGQQFCTEKRTIDLNIFREFIAWDGSTTRTLGYSRKAWLDDAELRTDLEANGLRLVQQSHEQDIAAVRSGCCLNLRRPPSPLPTPQLAPPPPSYRDYA